MFDLLNFVKNKTKWTQGTWEAKRRCDHTGAITSKRPTLSSGWSMPLTGCASTTAGLNCTVCCRKRYAFYSLLNTFLIGNLFNVTDIFFRVEALWSQPTGVCQQNRRRGMHDRRGDGSRAEAGQHSDAPVAYSAVQCHDGGESQRGLGLGG